MERALPARTGCSLRRPSPLALVAVAGSFLFLAAGPGQVAQAATLSVNTTADELNSGGDCSLREAIQAANTDVAVDACLAGGGADTIDLPAGTYTLGIAGKDEESNATGDLDITANLTINGAGLATTTVEGAGSNFDRVFDVASGVTSEISGVTIQNGSIHSGSDPSGGGIRNGGTLTVERSALRDNTSNQDGGGIVNSGTLTVTNSTFAGNEANFFGQGLANFGILTVTESLFTDNGFLVFGSGGGISNGEGAVATVTNVTFSGNRVGFFGGGLFQAGGGGMVTVTSSTVTGSENGGGIYNEGVGSIVVLKNTIVANNATADCPTAVTSAGHNLDSDGTCGLTATGDLPNIDPLLGPLQNNGGPTFTRLPLTSSPVIDVGSPDCPPPATDQRGVARPQGATCEIGAVEVMPIAFASKRSGNGDIYSMDTSGRGQTRLTTHPAFDGLPGLSADGTKIAFASNRDGNLEIYSMNANGTAKARLTTNAAADASPAFSPNGTKIAFASKRTGNGDIYLMNANGTAQTPLTSGPAADAEPSFSPDGTKIAFASKRTGNRDIYVMNANGSALTRLTTIAAVDSSPDWSPDGKRIAFASKRTGDGDIYVISVATRTLTRLTSDPAVDGEPAFLKGGKIAFASKRSGGGDVYVMNANGNAQTRLTTNPALDSSPDSP